MTRRPPTRTQLVGQTLRAARETAGLTQAALAAQVHITRQKLIDLEQGKPGVAIDTFLAVAQALGLDMTPHRPMVRVGRYPQLRAIAWNRRPDDEIPEPDALALYERNWDHVEEDRMPPEERQFLQRLIDKHGGGVFLHV